MAKQVKCDLCGKSGRLHRCEPGDWGNHNDEEVNKTITMCDDCFEKRSGFPACCQDYCGLDVGHDGICDGT